MQYIHDIWCDLNDDDESGNCSSSSSSMIIMMIMLCLEHFGTFCSSIIIGTIVDDTRDDIDLVGRHDGKMKVAKRGLK